MGACSAAGVLAAGAAFGLGGGAGFASDLLTVLQDAFFYCSVREYIMEDIIQGPYRELVAQKLAMALGVLSTTIMTIWVAYQGYQIITGANRNPVIPLFIQTGKMVLIMSLVSLIAANSTVIVDSVADFKDLISQAVANGADITDLIDLNLGITSLLNSITESMKALENGKDPNMITTTVGLIGQSGPAMLVAVLLMLAELSVTFAIMLAPMFIFFLLFQQTSALFWSWAKFLLGALFSMATLTLIGALVLKATAIYGGTVVLAYYGQSLTGAALFDISGSALRLAALGTLMSAIIMAIPHTIMQFFSAGAGFAAGAFGFAGAGALAGSVGMAKGMGGGTGLPSGLAQSQLLGNSNASGGQQATDAQTASVPGQVGGAQSIQQSAFAGNSHGNVFNAQSAIGRANAEASSDGSQHGLANGQVGTSGTKGLANETRYSELQSTNLQTVQQKQYSMAQAEEMSYDETRGIYRTASTDTAMAADSKLGRGGHLPVSAGGGGSSTSDKVDAGHAQVSSASTLAHAPSHAGAPLSARNRPGLNYGQPRNDGNTA